MKLDRSAATEAVRAHFADPLRLGVAESAAAILQVASERMVHAIEDITVSQGIDPRDAVIVAGGGAAGRTISSIARRLGCGQVLIPTTAAALSAAGALASNLQSDFNVTYFATTEAFDRATVNDKLATLTGRCEEFLRGLDEHDAGMSRIEYFAQARYHGQVWEVELPLRGGHFSDERDVLEVIDDFHSCTKRSTVSAIPKLRSRSSAGALKSFVICKWDATWPLSRARPRCARRSARRGVPVAGVGEHHAGAFADTGGLELGFCPTKCVRSG
jgi:N-methylhydantoinase A/oxoprolinase/acetone carboxylase beta subunit